MASIRTDRGMKMHIRYRLIQILEIVLWLGAVAGVGMVARDAWALREQGYATPVLLRFPDIIKTRINALFGAFEQAIGRRRPGGQRVRVMKVENGSSA